MEGELPEDPDQSAIINQDAEFENSSVDPGFAAKQTKEKVHTPDEQNENNDTEQNEQGTEQGAPGLGELDGTNPGSNHHPMDNN